MASYIFSYLPNDEEPTCAEMDTHLNQNGSWTVARLLETAIWYIVTEDALATVTAYVTGPLSENASYLVATCSAIDSKNLHAVP